VIGAQKAPALALVTLLTCGGTAGGAFTAHNLVARHGAQPQRVFDAVNRITEEDVQAFRRIRAAEVVGDADLLRDWEVNPANARVAARVELALDAVRLRSAARTALEVIHAEWEIERLRNEFLVRLTGEGKREPEPEPEPAPEAERPLPSEQVVDDVPKLALELSLESAEDLLLRLHPSNNGDAHVAIGLPSPAEFRNARAILEVVEGRLRSAIVAPCFAPDSAIATDPAVFRAHALKGLAAMLAADLAQCEVDGLHHANTAAPATDTTTGARTEPRTETRAGAGAATGTATEPTQSPARSSARSEAAAMSEHTSRDGFERAAAGERARLAREDAVRLLARARECELPTPEALGDVLTLAHGRAARDPSQRGRLLARAAESRDETISLVAKVVRWQDAGARGGLSHTVRDGADAPQLARLALAAEMRTHAARGASAAVIAAPLERALQRASASSSDPVESVGHLRATAEWIAARLPSGVQELATQEGTPATLFAIAAFGPSGEVFLDANLAMAARAARDPLIGPLLALRVAERLAARGDTHRAATEIVEAVRRFPGLPTSREALMIALDLLRREGDASSRALDDALQLAEVRFGAVRDGGVIDAVGSSDVVAWRLERLDLALFGAEDTRDLERASVLLDAFRARALDNLVAVGVSLRRIELGFQRLSAPPTPTTKAAREELRVKLAELGETAGTLETQTESVLAVTASDPALRHVAQRLSVVRAEIAMMLGDGATASALAERVLATNPPGKVDAVDSRVRETERLMLRAAKVAVLAGVRTDERETTTLAPFAVSPSLRTLALQSPAFRAWLATPLAQLIANMDLQLEESTTSTQLAAQIEALANLRSGDGAHHDVLSFLALAISRLALRDHLSAEMFARESLALDSHARHTRWILAESLRAQGEPEKVREAFATFRALAPMTTSDRDRYWWRGQLAQLEMIAATGGRGSTGADIVAHVNRLAALDASLGGRALAARFEEIRARAMSRDGARETERDTPMRD
jgi:hypothetical protein